MKNAAPELGHGAKKLSRIYRARQLLPNWEHRRTCLGSRPGGRQGATFSGLSPAVPTPIGDAAQCRAEPTRPRGRAEETPLLRSQSRSWRPPDRSRRICCLVPGLRGRAGEKDSRCRVTEKFIGDDGLGDVYISPFTIVIFFPTTNKVKFDESPDA